METRKLVSPIKTKATILQSFFEYRADYSRPCFDAWVPQNRFLGPVYDVLEPWGVQLRNLTASTGNNLDETSVSFGLPNIGIVVLVTIGSLKATAVNPDWSRVSQMIGLLEAVKGAVTKSVGVTIKSQHTIHGLHAKPDGLGQKETVLNAVDFRITFGDDVQALGAGIYRRTSSIVFDKSTAFHDAVFLRLEREYQAEATISNIAELALKDEKEALNVLKLEVEGL